VPHRRMTANGRPRQFSAAELVVGVERRDCPRCELFAQKSQRRERHDLSQRLDTKEPLRRVDVSAAFVEQDQRSVGPDLPRSARS